MQKEEVSERARLLQSSFVSQDQKMVQKELNYLRAGRPRSEQIVFHASLSFHPDDTLSDQKIVEITNDYLKQQGLQHCPNMVFRHHDTDHPHVHVLASTLLYDGTKADTRRCFLNNQRLTEELEKKYDLIRTKHERSEVRAATKQELEMVLSTGKPSEKMVMQELISRNLEQARDLCEFTEACRKNGIEMSFWKDGEKGYKGVTYFYNNLKMSGKALGEQFKGTEILKKLSYDQARDRQAINEANRRAVERFGEWKRDHERTRQHQRDSLVTGLERAADHADKPEQSFQRIKPELEQRSIADERPATAFERREEKESMVSRDFDHHSRSALNNNVSDQRESDAEREKIKEQQLINQMKRNF